MAIQVTDKAITAIKTAAAKRPSPPKALRVGIRGGGCTGFSYLFEWSDAEARSEDRVLSFEDGTVNVFIDPKSFTFLDGSTLDYVSTLMSSGFKWVNPNVKSTCSCGESVQF
jgi:iron-sulfur cluster assembly protein